MSEALQRIAQGLRELADEVESVEQDDLNVSDIRSSLKEALTYLDDADDSMPNRYSVVGNVENEADDASRHIDQARYELQLALDNLPHS